MLKLSRYDYFMLATKPNENLRRSRASAVGGLIIIAPRQQVVGSDGGSIRGKARDEQQPTVDSPINAALRNVLTALEFSIISISKRL